MAMGWSSFDPDTECAYTTTAARPVDWKLKPDELIERLVTGDPLIGRPKEEEAFKEN